MIEIQLTLVFAKSAKDQIQYQLRLPQGSTVKQAIESSGILALYPELSCLLEPVAGTPSSAGTISDNAGAGPNVHSVPLPSHPYSIGIWYKPVSLVEKLRSGDRIEIYRALERSAMQARKLRSRTVKPKDVLQKSIVK